MYTHIVISLESAALATEVIQDLPYLRRRVAWTASNAFNVADEQLEDLIEALEENNISFIRPQQYDCRPGLAYS